jgi:transcriptional regulator with PAS, ATPase and Fis domain
MKRAMPGDPKLGDGLGGAQAKELLSLLPDGVILLDSKQCVLALNHAAGTMLGCSTTSMAGVSLPKHLNRLGTDVWGGLADQIEAREKSEVIVKLAEGRTLLAGVRSVQRSIDGKARLLLTLRDLDVIEHERRRASNATLQAPVFRFASERKLRPDLRRQRQISPHLDRVMTIAERAVVQGARLLILGESGVGKTELARYVHGFVAEGAAPFVHVNCGSIPETLFEAELFGYERGAFTGALQGGRKGYIEAADGGTLFLDEVGEIPLAMQSRLLKFLESGAIQRVGSADERAVRVRVMSATNRNLEAMVAQSEFRRDLYFRLAVVPVRVKSLHESPELIGEITDYFLTILNQSRASPLSLTQACREKLAAYSFPGNIRELFNVLQQLSVMAEDIAGVGHLPPSVRGVAMEIASPATVESELADLKDQVKAYERQIIDRAIATYGSKRKAAAALGVDIGTIVRKTQVNH